MYEQLREQYRLVTKLPAYKKRIAEAYRIIDEALEIGKGYVSFSGGKDSLALFGLVSNRHPNITAYFFDSGAETPDTWSTIHAMQAAGYDIRVKNPRFSIIEMCQEAAFWGAIPNRKEVTWRASEWKRILLDEPALSVLADGFPVQFIGLRKDENSYRRLSINKFGVIHTKKNGIIRVCPLANWTGADVIAYCLTNDLPLSPIYLQPNDSHAEREHRRTGTALGTTFMTYGRFQQLRQQHPVFWQELLAIFPRLAKWG
jgi:3'-phosphoadenosine 5'-phosphosulfate sulfotransferase (PAPS reductase)/FAD synthetase